MLKDLIGKVKMLMSKTRVQRLLQQTKQLRNLLLTGSRNGGEDDSVEQRMRRGVIHKAALAAVAVILAVAMVFAMTAAWYSNVIQSNGLIFNVTEWGLDGNVDIREVLTDAAPGESGPIDLEVYNSAGGLIEVSLNVNKTAMYNDRIDMRKRLYFYIEGAATRNGEVTPRVYLNSQEEYSYTVLAKQYLYLGGHGNASPLMWEWVYDVTGYYFYGTVADGTAVTMDEYLRPITYDPYTAVFSGGVPQTVNGVSLAEFLAQLGQNDGYAGGVGAAVADNAGRLYYPVSVDENGTGVWIYCCSESEIEYESLLDTELGNTPEAERRQFNANLNVLAQQKQVTVATVATEADLRAALADEEHNMIVLSQDVAVTTPLTVDTEKEKILDLSAHTVSVELTERVLAVSEGSALTVMNGHIETADDHSDAVIAVAGGNVALSNVTLEGATDGIYVNDQEAKFGDTCLNIVDSTLRCREACLLVKGNGPVTDGRTRVTVENCVLEAEDYYAIGGNGSQVASGNWGTDITVRNSTLKCFCSGVYHPQPDSTMLLENCVVEAVTPLAVKGGQVTVKDCTITALVNEKAAAIVMPTSLTMSGFADVGAGIYVETGYDYETEVVVSGDTTVLSQYQPALLLYQEGNPHYRISLTGGTYSHDVSAFVADGYVCTADDNGRFVVAAQ